jgi:Tfp pilus assembly protein PilF
MEHKPAEALAEYKVALKLSPNRLNGLLSAGEAAAQAGMKDEARGFYKAAAEQTRMQLTASGLSLLMRLRLRGL